MKIQMKPRKPLGGRERDRTWREANRERLIEYQRKKYWENPEKNREISNLYYRQHRDACLAYAKEKYSANRTERRAKNLARRLKLRQTVLALLGNKCVCCNEVEFHFLEIDHILGGGTKHFEDKGTWGVLVEVRDHPERDKFFRILCSNCNKARAKLGHCPHNKGI